MKRERECERVRKISRSGSGSGSVVTEGGDVQQRATNQRDKDNKTNNTAASNNDDDKEQCLPV